MMSFNLIVLAGHVGRDPETKEIEGTTVTSFPLAVDTYKGRDASGKAKDEAMWVRVNAWGKVAETVSNMVKKGTPVLVSGELQIRTYTDKNKTERTSVEIRAEKVKLLDSKAKQEVAQAACIPFPILVSLNSATQAFKFSSPV